MPAKVFEHFEIPPDATGTVRAKCRHCASVISGRVETTSNFISHIKRKHRDISLTLNQPASNPPSSPKFKSTQPSMKDYVKPVTKYSNTDHRQVELTDALILYVAGDLAPLSVVESPYFANLMNQLEPRFQLPSRQHLSSKLLKEKSLAVQCELRKLLECAPSVCLTIDLWSNRQMKGFLGITGHFILDWVMQSVMIACKRFKGRHTAENIRQEYEETVSSYDISEKIMTIVTDNASNMVKAFDFQLPGYMTEKDTDSEENTADSEENTTDVCEDDSDDSEDSIIEDVPTHSRCYAHSLQLVVKDGLRQASQHLKGVIAKASNIVSHVRKSVHATEILEGEKCLQAANATRWNSQLRMIRSVLGAPEEKMKQLDVPQLTAYERKLLQELCIVLSPFETATDMVQQENNVSASLTVPVTLGLKHQLQQISTTYNNKMVTTLKSSIQQRLSHYEDDDAYLTAAVLDPRFKMRWCDAEKRSKLEASLTSKAATVNTTSAAECDIQSPVSKAPKLDDDFFSFMGSDSSTAAPVSTGFETELKEYLTQPCASKKSDPLAYWKDEESKCPDLSVLARRYLAIPASSAPVERLFSIAGKIFRPERCSMKDETFERLMMIECNSKLPKPVSGESVSTSETV